MSGNARTPMSEFRTSDVVSPTDRLRPASASPQHLAEMGDEEDTGGRLEDNTSKRKRARRHETGGGDPEPRGKMLMQMAI